MWVFLFIFRLSAVLAQVVTVTVTSTETATSLVTYTPTLTVQENPDCACTTTCAYDLCANVISTWSPFSTSPTTTTSPSSDAGLTTTTTTITRDTSTSVPVTSNIPMPSSLYTFGTTGSQVLDIDFSGDLVLRGSGNPAAFIFNADGSLTTYGSGLNIFANFNNVIAQRDINVAYGLGACIAPTRLRQRGGEILVFTRQIGSDGIAYGQWDISGNSVQLSANNSIFGFLNCISSTLSLYDMASDNLPSACSVADILASTVPQVSYTQYYSNGVSKASLYTALGTCSTSGVATTSPSTTSQNTYTVPNITFSYNEADFTSEAPLADWTSTGNPYPVFAMGVYDTGSLSVGSQSLQVLMLDGDGLDLDIVAWQLNEFGEIKVYGVPYALYANSSVNYQDADRKRMLCNSSPVTLFAARIGSQLPLSAVTGLFTVDPDIGLMLSDWDFVACNYSQYLQVVHEDCPVPANCTRVNPTLFLLDDDFINDAVFNAYKIFLANLAPTPVTYTTINATTVTYAFQQTDAVLYACDVLMAGSYFDFCSSELGYITTATVTNLETTTNATATLEASSTISVVEYPAVTTLTITTGSNNLTTQTSTRSIIVTYIYTSETRTYTTRNDTISTTSTSGTNTIITTASTETKVLTTFSRPVTTATAPAFVKKDMSIDDLSLRKRTQDQSLTPTELQPYAPSIIASGCSLVFNNIYNTTASPTTFVYTTDVTQTLNDTSTTFSSTVSVTLSTSYTFTGTTNTTTYTTTNSTTISTTQTNVNYTRTTTSTTITGTISTFNVQLVKVPASSTSRVTSTTLTTTTATRTLCDPSRFTGGALNQQNVIKPFTNDTKYNASFYPPNWSGIYPYLSWGGAEVGQMPVEYATGRVGFGLVCQAGVGNLANINLTNNWARVSQVLYICPQSQYWVRVMYKWLFTKGYPQREISPAGGSIQKSPDKYVYDILDIRVNDVSIASSDAAMDSSTGVASENPLADDASSLTGNFTVGGGSGFGQDSITLNLVFGCNRNNASLPVWDRENRYNVAYIYNITVQSSPFDNR